MTVRELKEILNNYPDDIEVMTKKTEAFGNIGEVNSVRKDNYGFFGDDVPCVLLTDEFESQEIDTEKHKEWPHKPCINYEDGCEEWAGCPCVHYKAESEDV